MDIELPQYPSPADGPILFAVDYDGTFARAPKLFASIIRLIFASGNAAIMVTGRSDETPWSAEVRAAIAALPVPIPIVFAGPTWKREAAERAGYRVNIWIDDFPEYVAAQDPGLAAPKQMGLSPARRGEA